MRALLPLVAVALATWIGHANASRNVYMSTKGNSSTVTNVSSSGNVSQSPSRFSTSPAPSALLLLKTSSSSATITSRLRSALQLTSDMSLPARRIFYKSSSAPLPAQRTFTSSSDEPSSAQSTFHQSNDVSSSAQYTFRTSSGAQPPAQSNLHLPSDVSLPAQRTFHAPSDVPPLAQRTFRPPSDASSLAQRDLHPSSSALASARKLSLIYSLLSSLLRRNDRIDHEVIEMSDVYPVKVYKFVRELVENTPWDSLFKKMLRMIVDEFIDKIIEKMFGGSGRSLKLFPLLSIPPVTRIVRQRRATEQQLWYNGEHPVQPTNDRRRSECDLKTACTAGRLLSRLPSMRELALQLRDPGDEIYWNALLWGMQKKRCSILLCKRARAPKGSKTPWRSEGKIPSQRP